VGHFIQKQQSDGDGVEFLPPAHRQTFSPAVRGNPPIDRKQPKPILHGKSIWPGKSTNSLPQRPLARKPNPNANQYLLQGINHRIGA